MQNTNTLCMGCMRDMGQESEICPHCGHHDDGLQTYPYLKLRTWLKDRYLVGKLISSNSEGCTYLGWDNVSQIPVYIREFMPADVSLRDADGVSVSAKAGCEEIYASALQSFLELARSLGRMRELSSLLPVYDIFELGSTAYYVSEYIVNISLESFLRKNGNKLNWEQVKALMMPLLNTLRSLHSVDMIHKGISPETIIVGRDGKLRFTGFCISEIRTSRGELSAELFSGYSAAEQYGLDGQISKATDIYAFAAVIYRMLTGTTPPEATSRITNDLLAIPTEIADQLPKYVLTALANALQILSSERTASVDTFHSEIANVSAMIGRQSKNSEGGDKDDASVKKSNMKTVLISLLCTVIVLGLAAFLIYNAVFKPESPAESDPVSFEMSSVPSDESTASVYVETDVVPDLKGKTYQEAKVICTNRFDVIVGSKVYSDSVAKGKIISQTPEGNASVKAAEDGTLSTIQVVISLGKSSGTMPDVSGLTYDEAFIKLVKAGFSPDIINTSEKYSVNVKPGQVVDTNPVAGTKDVEYDTPITLYINNRTDDPSSTIGGEVESIADISDPESSAPQSYTASAVSGADR